MANAFKTRPDHDRIFIDDTNAFNLVSRKKAFDAILRESPQLARIFHALYKGDTNIWLRCEQDEWTTLLSEQGFVQGCVFGPFGFGFATLDVYKAVIDYLAGGDVDAFFGAYSDDAVISAAHDNATEAFEMYMLMGGPAGLHVNFSAGKTEVLLGRCGSLAEVNRRVRNYVDQGLPIDNIKIHPSDGGDADAYGYIHLGVPVGSEEYKANALRTLIDDFSTLASCVDDLKEPQEEWVFLLWVLRQKFPYWLRHMSPSITLPLAPLIENLLRDKFNPIVGTPVSDDQWEQASLPVKSGGFGLGKVTDTITAAFVANVQETKEHVRSKLPSAMYLDHIDDPPEEFQRARAQFQSREIDSFVGLYRDHKSRIAIAVESDGFDLESKYEDLLQTRKLQFTYSKILASQRAARYAVHVQRTGTPADMARLHSANGSFAGAWLFSVPKTKNSIIPTNAFRMSTRMRLGIPYSHLPTHCMCSQHKLIDNHGVHLFACNQFRSLLLNRHNAIQKDFKALAYSGGIRADDQRLTVFRAINNDDGKRPDMMLPGMGQQGNDLLLDFTIGHPTCATYVMRAADTPHYTLNLLHNNKNRKYLNRCTEIGASFMPMAFESFGAVSEDVMTVMSQLVCYAAENTSIPYSVLLSYWKKRISTTLQVQNARIIMMASAAILARTGRRDPAFDCNVLMETIHNY